MKSVVILFVIWRIFLFVIALISPQLLPQFGARFPYYQGRLIESGLPHFIWSFGNFDGVHYLGIATNAYEFGYTQAFFPFYPILIKLISQITQTPVIIAALLVSNIAFLLALLVFYKLISKTHNKKIALWSIIFLLTFPTSFYFGAIYTESLFLLLTLSAFYLYQTNRMVLAWIVGAFASATRIIGLILSPLLVRKRKDILLSLLIVPLGFLAYVFYLKVEFNNPLYFLSSQEVFGQERTTTQIVLLPQVIFRYLKILLTTGGLPFANAAFELISTIFALTLLILSYKKIHPRWLVFSLSAVLLPTLTGTLASMPRYIIIAFPIYVFLASLNSVKLKIMIVAIFLVLLYVVTTYFTQGYWVA